MLPVVRITAEMSRVQWWVLTTLLCASNHDIKKGRELKILKKKIMESNLLVK